MDEAQKKLDELYLEMKNQPKLQDIDPEESVILNF